MIQLAAKLIPMLIRAGKIGVSAAKYATKAAPHVMQVAQSFQATPQQTDVPGSQIQQLPQVLPDVLQETFPQNNRNLFIEKLSQAMGGLLMRGATQTVDNMVGNLTGQNPYSYQQPWRVNTQPGSVPMAGINGRVMRPEVSNPSLQPLPAPFYRR